MSASVNDSPGSSTAAGLAENVDPQPTWMHVTLLVAYVIITSVWILHFVGVNLGVLWIFKRGIRSPSTESQDATTKNGSVGGNDVIIDTESKSNDVTVVLTKGGESQGTEGELKRASVQASGPSVPTSNFEKFLGAAVLFGAILTYFYICDYIKLMPQGERTYSRDIFLFLVFLLFLVSSAFTLKPTPDKILNREQTEEWKGWMQVMFVWYHYFKAKEWYNWIRVYIACYVWMTGFGNFSFFWVRKDYSLWRVGKMLFRLNFLVVFVTMITNNEYMLYYICAMHTYWFLTVYVFMYTLNSWNTQPHKMAIKFAAYAICNAAIFEIPGATHVVFRPFTFILGYHDSSGDILHEWSFRAGLDHWACFVGMLCAYNYPHFEALMNYLDSKSATPDESRRKSSLRLAISCFCVLVGVIWYKTFMGAEKYDYNRLHPYSSMLPILVFIVLRNIHPVLRCYHVDMFSWLGKITLETYLSQLHVYLGANATTLIVYLHGLPLLNFAFATIVYLTISYFLFQITNEASNFLLPKNYKHLTRNLLCLAALFLASAVIAAFFVIV